MSLSLVPLVALLVVATLLRGSIASVVGPNMPEIDCEETGCSKCYITLVKNVMDNGENVYNLSRAFFPPTEEEPVFVTVNYNFEGGGHQRWYWTSQTSTFLHPLEEFQFFSLFFGDFSSRAKTVNITLPNECNNDTDERYFELLTQRLKIHASTQKINPKIPNGHDANSASLTTLQKRFHSNNKLISTLYLYQIFVPIFITLAAGLIVFSMDERIDKFLPSTNEDQNAVVLSVVTLVILFFVFVIGMDITGIVFATTKVKDHEYSMYIHGDNGINALFILPLVFLILYDIGSCIVVIPLILLVWFSYANHFSAHWKKSHTVATLIVCIISVISNHSYYIIIALINDHSHAHSVGIYYIIVVIVYYLCFKLGWKTFLRSRCSACLKTNNKENIFLLENKKDEDAEDTVEEKPPIVDDETRGKCNLRTVSVIVVIILLLPFHILVTAAFVYIPIIRTVEEIPTQLNVIYQSLIVLFTALITYKLFVEPKEEESTLKDILQELRSDKTVLQDILKEMRITNEPKEEEKHKTDESNQKWVKIGEKTLKNRDRRNILDRDYCLVDSIIDTAMHLMRRYKTLDSQARHTQVNDLVELQYLSRMDESCKGSLETNGIQIIHTGRDHWVTVSTIGSTAAAPRIRVYIYDSLKREKVTGPETKHSSEAGDTELGGTNGTDQTNLEQQRDQAIKQAQKDSHLSYDTVQQISHLLNTDAIGNIDWMFPDVQTQDNGSDCGLFAIAFAFELCKGDHEALAQGRKFDTEKMRKHLVDCFENDEMQSFPLHTDN